MITIHKFPLVVADELTMRMPAGAKVLCVQMQHGVPCVWAEVSTRSESVTRGFAWRRTGQDCGTIPETAPYVGTVQMYEGTIVVHLYDLGER